MILYSTFYQKKFSVMWTGITIARLQDEQGNTKIVSMEYLHELVKENATAETMASQ